MRKSITFFVVIQLFFAAKIFSQGSGADGALTLGAGTTTINTVKSGISSTANAGQAVVNVTSAASFANTNLVLIIQMLGTNVGVWEIRTISSISVNAITMTANLTHTFTKTGSTSLAQVIKIPQYTNVTVGSGKTLTASAWDGTVGGVLIFYSNGTLTVDGTIDMNGKGYRGGAFGVGSGVFGPNPAGAGGNGGAAACNNGLDGTATAGSGASGSNSCGTCTAAKHGGEGGLRAIQTGATGSAGEGPAGGAGGGATGAVGGDNNTVCWTGSCAVIQMGSGGGGGAAGDISVAGGGGGGGGGSSGAGSVGSPGGQSNSGGDGGTGGAGGGIIFINANVFTGAGTGIIQVSGGNGGNGTIGYDGGGGGNGGNGGTGSAGNTGGAGGGGQGANGSQGGGAGAFGAGGVIYLTKASGTYSGTKTIAHGTHGSGAAGGTPGPGGTGGTGPCGVNGTNGANGSTGATGTPAVSPGGGGNGDIALPIELVHFDAIRKGDAVSLSWVTASEINNDYFIIEKSKDSKDWILVTNVKGAGNSSVSKYYFSVDNEPYSGASFYRLKQVDYNGGFSFSKIVPVEFNPGNENIFSVYPTLSSGDIDVSFIGIKDKQIFIVVRNIFGQEYYSKGFILDNDIFVQSISLSGTLPPGIYVIIASSDDRVFSKKIVIK